MAGEYKEVVSQIKTNFKNSGNKIDNELLDDLVQAFIVEVNENFENGTFEDYNANLNYGKSNLALFRHSMYLAKMKETSFGDNLIIGYWVAPTDFLKANSARICIENGEKIIPINENTKFCPEDMILIGRRLNNEKGFYIKALHLDAKGKQHFNNYDLNVAFRRDGQTVMFGYYKEERDSIKPLVDCQNAKLVLSDVSENKLIKDHNAAIDIFNKLYILIMSQDPKMKLDLMSFLFNEEVYEEKNLRTREQNNRAKFYLPDLGRD